MEHPFYVSVRYVEISRYREQASSQAKGAARGCPSRQGAYFRERLIGIAERDYPACSNKRAQFLKMRFGLAKFDSGVVHSPTIFFPAWIRSKKETSSPRRIMEEGAEIICPFCGQAFELMVDTSVARQQFTTDCEICCRPFLVVAECEPGEILSLDAREE
jgi:hypothetical protein